MSLVNKTLIIGGQPKAGTSSLFHWLSQHPGIEPSRVKEVRFFLDEKYPLPSGARYNGQNGREYLSFFRNPTSDKTLLDATPDYLYCKNASNISAVLPNSRIVFIVRDPVERTVSWYKFAAQIGRLEKGMTFEDYVEYQLSNAVTERTPIHLRALEQNRVGEYLPIFKRCFAGRYLVKDFSDIRNDPRGTIQEICAFSGLDPKFYDAFDFAPRNVSTGERAGRSSRVYYRARAAFNYLVKPSPRLISIVRPIGVATKRALVRSERIESFEVPPALAQRIMSHAHSNSS
ncbi:sulfotransferase [Seongchinamella sediminis]|uniref:Sulfotransferase n=1 Tax=Seongchinamella sediminis TaxID=2283635 RepID=A0A3L7DV57_9GAMM|nr:sulfotransferase [Seongchinamella sediminis]RLQ21184.1 sulfotransferase [Seongchinamella sediminis]